jgi:hypothetical protein
MELIRPRISEDSQILAALASTGAGFEALGGSSLMLTEPVENSVDSIIEGRKKGLVGKGIVRIFIDRGRERVIITDNGLGFVDPRHICEKPFDSLKKYDPDLTGKFARGLQGFRSYCEKLTFITRRLTVPAGEQFDGQSGKTILLEFGADRIEVGAGVGKDDDFALWSWGEFNHGAAAIYSDWKAGEFAKIRKEKLVRRIERHFGELIRKGQIEILVWEGKNLPPGKKLPPSEFYACVPRDYSKYEKVDLPPVRYTANGKMGVVEFELYLMPGAKSDKDYRPFLMYKDRPVGDSPIALVPEFSEELVWNSSYLTGFVRADFCEINELRLALKPSPERDFLYQGLLDVEPRLGDVVRKHHLGLIDIRRAQEISQLVNRLQTFLRDKKIFDFRLAKDSGTLSTGDKSEVLTVTSTAGADTSRVSTAGGSETVVVGSPIVVTPVQNVLPGTTKDVHIPQTEMGGTGSGGAHEGAGGPGTSGQIEGYGKDGYREEPGALKKSLPTEASATPGNPNSDTERKVRRRKPRGFNMINQENEFSDELSTYDPMTSTIIINSASQRYKARDDPEDPINKGLMDYLAELYIWEICKLAGKQNSELPVMDTFLMTKYEFFEVS